MLDVVKRACSNESPTIDENATPKAVKVSTLDLLSVMHALHEDETMFFDSLSCVTGIDNGTAASTMEVAYNLYSIPYNHHLMVKVILPRDQPRLQSVIKQSHRSQFFGMILPSYFLLIPAYNSLGIFD